MKTRIVWLTAILLTGFIGLSPCHAQVVNLIPNGDFEAGSDAGWNFYGNLTVEAVTECVGAAVPEAVIQGNYCMHVVVPVAGAGPHEMGLSNGGFTFEAGKKYTVSCFIKTKSGTLDFRIKPEHAAAPWEAYNMQTFTATEEWQEFYTTTDVFTENITPASPSFHLGFAPGDFWMDDIKLYEGDYVPSIVRMTADKPSPEDGATNVPRDVVLGWKPGPFAETRNVYFGTTYADVDNANVTSTNVFVGTGLTETTYDPDGLLAFGQTYYWRVDEIDAPPDSIVHKGEIWSFVTETFAYTIDGANIIATASSVAPGDFGPEHTIDGSGLDENDQHSTNGNDMWLSGNEPQGAWIQYEFDKKYKLYQMWIWNSNQVIESVFGLGLKDVTIEYSSNGTDWTTLAGVTQFNKAPGTLGYVHNTTVDLNGAVAKYVRLTATSNWGGMLTQYSLSEVRFFYVPVLAEEPSPEAGATGVNPAVILDWRVGREAATHNLYLSTDEQAVVDGTVPVVSVTESSYSTDLDLGSTYYWRVDEVNDAQTPTSWAGDVWSFSTSDTLVVDDFESYNDIDPPDPKSNRIFESWSDGFQVPTNGALVGYDPPQPSYTETTVIRNGRQAMPLFYSNTGGATYSEVTRTLAPAQNWTKHGAQTLVLYVHGIPGNTGQLYAKVNGVKVPYSGDAIGMTKPLWNQWNIELASIGINPASVTTLSIGIDGAGAAGTLYIDDIVLYRFAPPQPTEQLWIEAESGTITEPMKIFSALPGASGGQYIEVEAGNNSTGNPPTAGGAASYPITVQGGTYKIHTRVIAPSTSNDSIWVWIQGATTQTTNHSSGWVRFNDMAPGSDWHWDVIHSSEDGNNEVEWTMAAGTYTLEIAYREEGASLDAMLIRKID